MRRTFYDRPPPEPGSTWTKGLRSFVYLETYQGADWNAPVLRDLATGRRRTIDCFERFFEQYQPAGAPRCPTCLRPMPDESNVTRFGGGIFAFKS